MSFIIKYAHREGAARYCYAGEGAQFGLAGVQERHFTSLNQAWARGKPGAASPSKNSPCYFGDRVSTNETATLRPSQIPVGYNKPLLQLGDFHG